MKTLDAINAFQAIQKVIDDPSPKSVKFSYALLKNRRNLEDVVQKYNLDLANHADPVLDELLRKWREIAPAYAEQLGDGTPMYDQAGMIKIKPNKVVEYNLACEEVMIQRPEYQAAFAARNNLIAELQSADSDVAIYPIGLSQFPAETDFTTLEVLYPFIDGDR